MTFFAYRRTKTVTGKQPQGILVEAMAQATEHNEIGNTDKGVYRKLELGRCRNRGTKGPFAACPQ